MISYLERMPRRHNAFVDSQGITSEDREEEIHLLYRQCEKYEDIINEAEYVTYEQRADLKVKKREIEEELSMMSVCTINWTMCVELEECNFRKWLWVRCIKR